jgi:hypothetical protein
LHDPREKTCNRPRVGPTKQDVSAAILSTFLLVSPASPLSTSRPPSLVEPESGAWAIVHAGQLWVCWSPGPDCFERVVFDDGARTRAQSFEEDDEMGEALVEDLDATRDEIMFGSEAWRIGFWGSQSLWIEHDEQRFRVARGQRQARLVDEPAPIRLLRISPAACGPDGQVPTVIGGRLSWQDAPRCVVETAPSVCVSAPGPRLRTPTPVRLRAGFEVAAARAWTSVDEPASRRLAGGVELNFVVELSFDWQARAADRRARAALARRSRAQLRQLPAVVPGPLADAEIEALTSVVCHGGRP